MDWTSSRFRQIAAQVLTEYENRIYRFHFLLGADERLCCRQLVLDSQEFRALSASVRQKLIAAANLRQAPVIAIDTYTRARTCGVPALRSIAS